MIIILVLKNEIKQKKIKRVQSKSDLILTKQSFRDTAVREKSKSDLILTKYSFRDTAVREKSKSELILTKQSFRDTAVREKSFLLLISQQNILNKILENAFVSICYSCVLFYRPSGKKTFFQANLPMPTPSIYVRNFAFGQCVVCIVSNKNQIHFIKF